MSEENEFGVDMEIALQLKELMGSKYSQLAQKFFANTEIYIAEIGAALEAGDRAGACATAHKMKSSSGQFGMVRLQEFARRVERCDGGDELVHALYKELQPAYDLARGFMGQSGLK